MTSLHATCGPTVPKLTSAEHEPEVHIQALLPAARTSSSAAHGFFSVKNLGAAFLVGVHVLSTLACVVCVQGVFVKQHPLVLGGREA
jgi:hypothetical protein